MIFVRVIRTGVNWRHSNLAAEYGDGFREYFLILIKTAAFAEIGADAYKINPNSMILMRKGGAPLRFSKDAEFVCDWICFDMSEAEAAFIQSLELPFDRPTELLDASSASAIIKLISAETLLRTPRCTEFAESMMQALFYKLSATRIIQEEPADRAQNSPYTAKLTALRSKIYATPEEHWTVERMCHELCISRTHLHRLYTETFGVTCYNDVINSKMDHAKYLLCNSALPIHEISVRCAFDNDVSFMRCFKKATGMTPTQFRSKSCSKV